MNELHIATKNISEEIKDNACEILDILPDDPSKALSVMCYLLAQMLSSIDGADFKAATTAIQMNMDSGPAQ